MNTQVQTVVLLHTAPDGPHLDWMIEPPDASCAGPDDRVLATWRLDVDREPRRWRIDDSFTAVRLVDHRRAFLGYEGELTGGRGRVQRIEAGAATATRWEDASIDLDVRLGGFEGRVTLRRASDPDAWTVQVLERRGGRGMME